MYGFAPLATNLLRCAAVLGNCWAICGWPIFYICQFIRSFLPCPMVERVIGYILDAVEKRKWSFLIISQLDSVQNSLKSWIFHTNLDSAKRYFIFNCYIIFHILFVFTKSRKSKEFCSTFKEIFSWFSRCRNLESEENNCNQAIEN